jgi:ABC-type uncharacterized transport system substrate-binding protein
MSKLAMMTATRLRAFERVARAAALVSPDPLFRAQNEQIVALAAQHAIPTGHDSTISTTAGGLMSYGTDLADVSRQLGVYAGRILRGEKTIGAACDAADRVRVRHQS